MTDTIVSFPQPAASRAERAGRYQLEHVSDDALHAEVKTLSGRYNGLTAELLAHLAEVDARRIYRERACSSLYTYCVYELRFSEDEAQRRARAARTARAFPVLFEMLAEGAIHLTGLLLLAPYLTLDNHAALLARARFRTKREIEHLVAEVAPRPDVPARIEPLGPRPAATGNLWQAYTASLRGPVRELVRGVEAGQAPPAAVGDATRAEPRAAEPADAAAESCGDAREIVVTDLPAPERVDETPALVATKPDGVPKPIGALRYRVEFTASEQYVELLEEARNLLQHQVPDRDVALVHELAMAAFVEHLTKRRSAAGGRKRQAAGSVRAAPERVTGAYDGVAPARVADADAELDGAAPERVMGARDGSAPERVKVQRRRPVGSEGGNDDRELDAVGGRYVPAEVRRAVWERDGGCCTFADSSGRGCHERAGLEIHHEHAFALGGRATISNLRLVCRAHNALFAERDFGRAHVERMRMARQGGSAAG